MRIILSPTKKMIVEEDLTAKQKPALLENTKEILAYLRTLSLDELKKLWKCNDKIAAENYERIQSMDLDHATSPALLSYVGLAFQHIAPNVLTQEAYDYLEDHLRILSGFYGVLKPFDAITPYRLEMQTKTKLEGYKDLYSYWDYKLYSEAVDDSHIIINLASREYSKCIENFLSDDDLMITIVFGELKDNKVITKATKAKMARGEMVRYLAENQINDLEGIKKFHEGHYRFDEERSNENTYYFIENLFDF